MSDDVLLLFMVVVIVYHALTGRLSGGYTRKENPIYFWVMTPILLCLAAFLLVLVFYDLYHRGFK